MRKPFWASVMIAGTVVTCSCLLIGIKAEPPTEAHIVAVSRQDVYQVIAMSGRLAYAEERIVVSPTIGVVDRILVEPGQRVGTGEALVRMASSGQEQILSAAAASATAIERAGSWLSHTGWQASMGQVLRAEAPCTVREIYIEANMPLAAGTPVLRLSSNDQLIRCNIAEADVSYIQPGMWAWISSRSESCGLAQVETVGDLAADPTTGLTHACVTLRPQQHIDAPEGAVVDVEVYLAGSSDVLALPLQAITERKTVWWVTDGRCTEIDAEIVMTDEMNAWVALPEGMEVAVGEFEEGQRIVRAAK